MLYLSGNPWTCDLDFVKNFLRFLSSFPSAVQDTGYLECISVELDTPGMPQSSRMLLEYKHFLDSLDRNNRTGSQRHNNVTSADLDLGRDPGTYVLIIAGVVFFFLVIVVVVVYVNRHLIQVLCFTRLGCRMSKMAPDESVDDRPYDAFISYSNKDEDFVIRQLAPR